MIAEQGSCKGGLPVMPTINKSRMKLTRVSRESAWGNWQGRPNKEISTKELGNMS